MSIEVSLITSLLAAALGSTSLADSVVELFKKFYSEKKGKLPEPGVVGTIIDTPGIRLSPKQYFTSKTEADIVTDAAINALKSTHNSIASIRDERMRQAKLAFNAALTLMIIGVVIIFIGIGILMTGGTIESGAITIVSGTISEALSALVFKFNKEANNRLDEIRKELARIEMAKVGLSLAKEIADLDKRDSAIAELTKTVQNYG
ncbi:MAG: hypothetical protein RPU32_08235 [Candidatus Sedimenticola sp. (ex Thyasira tokunagai)]